MKRQVMTLDAPGVLRPLAMLRRRHQERPRRFDDHRH